MKKVLFMHGGSGNHGCEAIVRTSAKLLGGPEDVVLWSQNREEDEKYGAASFVERVCISEELQKYSPSYFEAYFRRKVLKQKRANLSVFLRDLFKNNVAVSVGGDNYCYPWSAKQGGEIDRTIRQYCRATVLWACSVGEDAFTPEVIEDIKGFDLITAREQITYDLLKQYNPNVVKVADPAFLLETEELPLPEAFLRNNTVGINVSPMIADYSSDKDLVLKNYRELVRFILQETDMNVCLIPHVIWKANDDRIPIQALAQEFADTGRVCAVGDANCMQLKGYIARCRFFVGARTHATIAAYSSCVPTLVVGYSVKSRGIAQDLFGSDEGYVLPVQNLCSENDLSKQFSQMMEHESDQRAQLERVIPAYKKKAEFDLEGYLN